MSTLTFPTAAARVKGGESSVQLAKELYGLLSDAEKIAILHGDEAFWKGIGDMFMSGYNLRPYSHGAIQRLEIPGFQFSDGPRGATIGSGATVFPVSTARGATWDPSLEKQIGIAIGKEVRLKGCNFFGGVCINLPRHPAWGRYQESYGEDPLLLGEFGAALTEGVQENVMACVKHYALNSMENARFTVDVTCAEDALHEVYLPHFRRCVEAGAMAIMSAYNSVNGEWCGQNRTLLTDVLRDQWGFKGVVMSDFIFGLRNATLSVKNGLDIEACFAQQRAQHLPGALEDGSLSFEELEAPGLRILATQLEYMATRTQEEPNPSVFFSAEHRALARTAAARSIVLLKNASSTGTPSGRPLLPLPPSTASIALIGRLAKAQNTGDRGSSNIRNENVKTPYQGLKAALPSSTKLVLSDNGDIADAVEAAKKAEVAILVVGYTALDEGECIRPAAGNTIRALFPPPGPDDQAVCDKMSQVLLGDEEFKSDAHLAKGGDRESLRLLAGDEALIKAVSEVNANTIVVIVTAGPVIMPWRDSVPSILIGWYAGCEGGPALADVLLGTVDASGRLPYSIPDSEEHLPFFDRDATAITYDRWHGQRLLDRDGVKAAFPIGWGLSFTSFTISGPLIIKPDTAAEKIHVTVSVRNNGSRPGRHVVQVYGCQSVDPAFPPRVLVGFQSIQVAAGATVTVDVEASTRPLQKYKDCSWSLVAQEVSLEVGAYAGDETGVSGPCQFEQAFQPSGKLTSSL